MAETINDRSGSPVLRNGVGTQILTASIFFKTEKSVHIVLLDIQLPEIDGYEVAKKIRKINPNVPIIAQTAHSMAEDKKKCFDVGCNEYLSKPISYEIFIDTLGKYLN